uniref:Uncharacterized protein n=1 Tax=viral metagenome TaxID=1070528 RepID=A0A6H1ZSX5_9ZZZZ
MAGLDDFFEELEKSRKPQPKPMWGEQDPSQFQGGGGGLMGIVGKVAQIGGAAATMAGFPMVGIPLSVGGGALSGGAKGGITGALKGGAIAGGTAAAGQGLGAAVEGLKAPTDVGAMTAFSSQGAPMTIPGIRPNPIEAFSSGGSPMTIPGSPKQLLGGS